MERTNIIKWKKVGRGSLRLGNRIYKENETFTAPPDQIPKSFRDIIVPLGDLPAEEEANKPEKEEVQTHEYTKKHIGGGWYHVFDENGKQINEQNLRKDAADSMIESLKE